MVAALGSGENTERSFFLFWRVFGKEKRGEEDSVLVWFLVSANCLASC